MKTFIIALVFICIIASVVVCDVIISHKFSDHLLFIVDGMPEEYSSEQHEIIFHQINEVGQYWQRAKKFLVVTVNYQYITAVSIAYESLFAAVQTKDESNYCVHRRTLIVALENLRKFGSISIETIF